MCDYLLWNHRRSNKAVDMYGEPAAGSPPVTADVEAVEKVLKA